MDGPSMNHLFLKKFCIQREEKQLAQLLDIGSCGLHMINRAFKTGAEKSPWQLKKILKSLWQILHDSPTRRDDYINISGSIYFLKIFDLRIGWIVKM